MVTRLVLLAALLLVGCEPGFTYERCANLCRSCGVVECGVFCGRLDDRMLDPECVDAASVAWACTESIGCDFPRQCQPSLTMARECGR